MSSMTETSGLSPAERARRYLANAENARSMAAKTLDDRIKESLEKLAAHWEFLADYTDSTGKLR